ncbi:hypothetical protein PN36_33020 [Candidatus Thiomargarita nelsonii]|uniref:Uncharacterized protein n=1 Tax=Candidatus Thiomargarita nelsonii TaxID=1003181 RepID=A0A4E0RLD0_9GAMM|nr:hypothetical protein PN36_33020 [Candidatus Thiomargarita nelsonii]
MPFPLIPLLVGAAVGSGVTFLATNKTARQKINQSASQLTDTVKSGVKATKAKLSGEKDTPPTETVSEAMVEPKS